MVTQLVAGRVYDYNRTVGRGAISGMGFNSVTDLALGDEDRVYVLNRGWEFVTNVPWNRTARGTRVSVITIGDVPGDEEFVLEFSKYGDGNGELIWPAGIAVDSQEHVFITDEWLNRVSVFDREGNFLNQWGATGTGDGQFDGPSGITLDSEENVYIVDSRNHRVQKFAKGGEFLSKWGGFGSNDGELDSPWGITLDQEGYAYIADHKNHRTQKFTVEGEFVGKFGSYGTGRGELNRPSDGRFITSFMGDAQELSKWAKMVVEVSPQSLKRRREARSLEPEWRLALPRAVTFDSQRNRLIISDTQRNRLQIYDKIKDYTEPQRNI